MSLDVPKIPETVEKIKDRVFDEYMKQRIMMEFYADLKDYFTEEEIDIFRSEFSKVSDAEFESIISIPHELREKIFEKIFSAYNKGLPLEDLVCDYIRQVSSRGFGIGYHTSPHDFGPSDGGKWNIKGTEKDHRDDDRMMAYYSTQYRHLFKKRHPKFIYAVRTSFNDDSHKTDGNWHRADTLSVIMKVPFEEVIDYVESTVRKEERPDDENHRAFA
ncbi:MAG: hypothetical protein ACK42D_02805 [Candidatus Paceibacteria bacterium]